MDNQSSLKPIAIYGAGGFGLEVALLIEQINAVQPQWEIIGFFDDGRNVGSPVNDWKIIGGLSMVNSWESELMIAMALGVPAVKRNVVEQITNPNVSFPTLIHPSVIMGNPKYLEIGQGSIVCAGCIITTNITIGQHVILNLACTVGHECVIGDYSAFMPTCNISGEVQIGQATFWGTGAKIINRKVVGSNVTIGAGAVVIDNIPDNCTAAGVPAKVIKR